MSAFAHVTSRYLIAGLLVATAGEYAVAQTTARFAPRAPAGDTAGFGREESLQRLRSSSVWTGSVSARYQERRRASNARIAAQIGGGALAAGLLGLVAWKLLDNPEGADRRVKGDAGYTPNANTAYAAGSFLGSVLAVYWLGRGDGSRGSLGATALGAGLATIPIALGRHEPYLPIIGLVLGAPAQAVGATIGYQLTRREP
jgi:hypothetical protein